MKNYVNKIYNKIDVWYCIGVCSVLQNGISTPTSSGDKTEWDTKLSKWSFLNQHYWETSF